MFYRGFDRRPAALVRPADAGEVAQVVRLAGETGAELAVRSGGHSLAGHSTSDGGIVLDLSGLTALEIDPDQRTAWVQTGLTAGAYTVAAGEYGLATGFGDTARSGSAGLPLAAGMVAPPMPFVPPEQHGKPVVMALLAYAGRPEAGERAVAPFKALATPILDLVKPMRYPELFEPAEEIEVVEESARSMFVDAVDRAAAEAILEHLQASTAPMAVAQLRVLGGAMARVPVEATAFAHRGRRIMAGVGCVYQRAEEQPVHEAWADGFAAALRQGEPGVYVNFLTEEGQARVREAYPGSTWERLVEVKRRYDPGNLFRLNQNIPPTAG